MPFGDEDAFLGGKEEVEGEEGQGKGEGDRELRQAVGELVRGAAMGISGMGRRRVWF